MTETRSNGLYDRDYDCPYCGGKFKTKRVLTSRIVVLRKDPDFCPYYRGLNPLFYEVKVCPYCSYAFTDGFGSLKRDQKAKLEQLHKHGAGGVNFWGERDLGVAREAYRRALLAGRVVGQKHLIMAGLSMRMAWMYRYSGDVPEERRFLIQGLNQYELAYEQEPFEEMGMDWDTLHYLLGELSGELGRYAEAKRWFGKVIPSHKVKRALHNMAEDQWEKYKAEMESGGAVRFGASQPEPEVRQAQGSRPDSRAPDLRAPDLRAPDSRVPDSRAPDVRCDSEYREAGAGDRAEDILRETEIAKKKIDEDVFKEMIQL
jgi:uncharacterized protein (DUF2225 family)